MNVKEHAENAKVWHDVWVQSGKPKQGDIANMKRKTRLKYHYAIRYVTKENIRIRNNKMGEAVSSNNDRVLWDEVKKMTKTNNNLPNIIDEKTEVEEISNKKKQFQNEVLKFFFVLWRYMVFRISMSFARLFLTICGPNAVFHFDLTNVERGPRSNF